MKTFYHNQGTVSTSFLYKNNTKSSSPYTTENIQAQGDYLGIFVINISVMYIYNTLCVMTREGL